MKSNVNSGYYVVLFIIVVFQVQLLFFLTDRLWQREISRAALLILKRLRKRGEGGWGVGGQFEGSPVVFRKICLLKREWDPVFDITISLIFPENLTEISQVVQKIWRITLSILDIFIDFWSIFRIFWHSLVTKNLVASVYNR